MENTNAKVIKVFKNREQVVINRGSEHGVNNGDKYIIFEIGEELFDIDTEESLGFLEIVKGKGKVIHVQPKMATLESMEYEAPSKVITKKNTYGIIPGYEEEVVKGDLRIIPFNNPIVGDKAKKINR